MWRVSALQPTSEVAAFESFLENTEGAMDEATPEEDAPLTPLTDDNPAEDEEDLESEEDEELDEDAAEDEVAADAEGEPKEGESAEGDADISTIEALADFFEVEQGEVLQNLEVEGLNGENVSIGDALDGWRESERIFDERAATLESDHRNLVVSTQETSNQHLQRMAILTQGLINRIKDEYSTDRMAAARMEDPERYAELVDGKVAAEKLINDSIGSMDEEAHRRETQSKESIQTIMAKQNALLLQARPDWQNQKVLGAALKSGTRYLLSNGWEQTDIDGIMDHRILLMVDDAVAGARLRKGSDGKTIDKLRKRGLKKPTTGLRARSRRDPENPKNRARDKAYARLEQSGDAKDAVDLFLDRM
jgi:hypothetical protein